MISNSADKLFRDATYCRCILETLLKWQPCEVEFKMCIIRQGQYFNMGRSQIRTNFR